MDDGRRSGRHKGSARRKSEPLTAIVGRLEEEVAAARVQLEQAAAANALARAHISVLLALDHAHTALQLLAAPRASGGAQEDAQSHLVALDAHLLVVRQELARDTAAAAAAMAAAVADMAAPAPPPVVREGSANGCTMACSGGGSGGRQSASCHAPTSSAQGSSVATLPDPERLKGSDILMSIHAARGCITDKAAFVSHWRDGVSRLALLLHRKRNGDEECEEEIVQATSAIAATFGGVLLTQPWIAELMAENLETGAREEAPPRVWASAAAACRLSRPQAALYAVLNKWWCRCAAAMGRARRELAAAALSAPQDVELQATCLAGLEAVQRRYLSLGAAALVVGVGGILREATADLWVSCLSFGFLPNMTGLLAAMQHGAAAPAAGGSGGEK